MVCGQLFKNYSRLGSSESELLRIVGMELLTFQVPFLLPSQQHCNNDVIYIAFQSSLSSKFSTPSYQISLPSDEGIQLSQCWLGT